MFKVGDRVRIGVYVNRGWIPAELGEVVSVSSDTMLLEVDTMSLHGGKPWIHLVRADHCRLENEAD